MKKVLFYILFLLLIVVTNSCVEQTSDTTYQVLGVGRSTPEKTILTQDGYLITSAEIERMSDLTTDDCFRLEFKTEEYGPNSDEVYPVKMLRVDTINNYSLSPVFTDTTVFYKDKNEEFLNSIQLAKNVYIDKYLFLHTAHKVFLQDEEELFDLSYNWEETPEADENGNRVYDLFLRAFKNGGDTISKKHNYTTAFDISQLVDRISPIEQEAGKEELLFRINYASKYDEVLEKMTWAVSDTFFIKIK
ncbi:hypothetical protein LJC57_07745 [Parabacteroides sp. OttesenSCG-928-G07]|nr:hypothetical protein [Parabacteroides sp. OttesenSCG-928-G07]